MSVEPLLIGGNRAHDERGADTSRDELSSQPRSASACVSHERFVPKDVHAGSYDTSPRRDVC